MKSITNILRRSNLTPFERVKALIHNDVHREKTGKDALSESDIHSLTKGWRGTNPEISEYNKYIEIVRLEAMMKMDAQMFLYRSEVSILRNQRVLDNFVSSARLSNDLKNYSFLEDISVEDSIKFIVENTYLEYDKTLHIHTFNKLPREIKDDLILLDEEVATSSEYLADQVFLYEMFGNKKKLSADNKNAIIDRIYSRMHFEGARKIKKDAKEKDGFLLHTCFAELPTKELLEKIIKDSHLTHDDEDVLSVVEQHAEDKGMSMEQIIKDEISNWLDSGLFVQEYSPMYLSERLDTWNGDTKNNHKKIFMIWYKELQKSKKYFKKLLDDGKLERKTIKRDFLGVTRKEEVITGTSLYACEDDIGFVEDYRKQIETLIPISNIFLFIQKNAIPTKNHSTLCEFKNLSRKTSGIFDIDMSEMYNHFIDSYEQEIKLLNFGMNRLLDFASERLYKEKSFGHTLNIKEESFKFNTDVDCDPDDITERYKVEFNKDKY